MGDLSKEFKNLPHIQLNIKVIYMVNCVYFRRFSYVIQWLVKTFWLSSGHLICVLVDFKRSLLDLGYSRVFT